MKECGQIHCHICSLVTTWNSESVCQNLHWNLEILEESSLKSGNLAEIFVEIWKSCMIFLETWYLAWNLHENFFQWSTPWAYGSVILMHARQCRRAEWGPWHAPTYNARLLVENVSTSEKYRKSHCCNRRVSTIPYICKHINPAKLAIPTKHKRGAIGNEEKIQYWSHTESLRRNVSGARPEEDAGASVWRSTRDFSNPSSRELATYQPYPPSIVPMQLSGGSLPWRPTLEGEQHPSFRKGAYTSMCACRHLHPTRTLQGSSLVTFLQNMQVI